VVVVVVMVVVVVVVVVVLVVVVVVVVVAVGCVTTTYHYRLPTAAFGLSAIYRNYMLQPTTDCRQEQLEETAGDKTKGKGLSADAVQKSYNENITVSKESEPVTKSWVDMAIYIYNRALCHDEVVDRAAKSPFNYITVLYGFVSKARVAEQIKWCFVAIGDLLASKELRLGDLAGVRTLIGDAPSKTKGLVDLLMLQREMKEYLIGPALSEIGLSDKYSTKLRDVFKTHDSYRNLLTGLPDTEDDSRRPNTSWQAGWPSEVLAFMSFVEDATTTSYCCYHCWCSR